MTHHRYARRIASAMIAICSWITIAAPNTAKAQDLSTGALNVTVQDPSGAADNGAQLVLKDVETNDVHTSIKIGRAHV